MENEEKKLPKGAMRFVDHDCHAFATFADDDDERKKPSLKMVAYSGGVIKNHWYWDDLAIDLNGIKFEQKRFPVLEDHLTERKIAHISKPVIENGKLMAPDDAVFLKTEAAQEFIMNTTSNPPFPYQSSIYAKPSIVERISEDASVEVNGFTLKGPASVWRECSFQEMSVCVFGWDSQTEASAFSKEVTEEVAYTLTKVEPEVSEKKKLINRKKEVNKKMTLEELKEKHPDLFAQIESAAKAAATAEFADKETTFKTEIDGLKQTNETLTAEVSSLRKSDDIRSEKELAEKADRIWDAKLAASDVPDRPDLMAKIKKHVSHHKFVDENGILDVEKFKEAIDTEIESWLALGVQESVIGSGETLKEVDETRTEDQLAEDTSDVNRMLEHVGQKTD
jgi:hypothetical protein